jgi:hypothetical protein
MVYFASTGVSCERCIVLLGRGKYAIQQKKRSKPRRASLFKYNNLSLVNLYVDLFARKIFSHSIVGVPYKVVNMLFTSCAYP